ncbi:hypothetical protein CEQ30_18375 [Nocardia brasiliensis]|nr:hypothetical protein CEQ30_18375 [Nocardia brasiliensis]SUB40384.1 Uncharacterised protein [Nocardia brasiliensis]
MKKHALQAIPLLGWGFLLIGAIAAVAGHTPESRALRALWSADAFLSIVVHAAQIPSALRATASSDHSRLEIAVMTQIFGMTRRQHRRAR